jgi:HAMP domain-containing protein
MDERQTTKRTVFISLRVKLLVGFTLLFTIVFAGAFYWFNSFAEGMALNWIKDDLSHTLFAAAGGVNVDEFVALCKEGVPRQDGFTDDPRYWRQMDWLKTIHEIEPRAWPFTYIKGEKDKEVIFVNDVWAIYDTNKAAKFLEPYMPKTYVLWQGLEDTTLYLDVYTDPWGNWVTGYTPIRNSKGERVGGIGIDFRADYVDQVKQAIRDRVVTAFAITYAILFILVFLISGTLSRPIIALTRAAEHIGEGDYEQDLSGLIKDRFPDEIDTLAKVFSIMVGKVYQREQTLRRQVEELRIEIDEVKRQRQVSEIVETDFFQELQARARTMRSRSRRPAQSEDQDAPGDKAPQSDS